MNHAYKYKCSPLVGIVKMKNSLGTLVLFHVYIIICIYLLVMYTRHAIFSYIHYFARTRNSVTSLWLVYINTSTIRSIGTLRVITIITLTSIGVFTDDHVETNLISDDIWDIKLAKLWLLLIVDTLDIFIAMLITNNYFTCVRIWLIILWKFGSSE